MPTSLRLLFAAACSLLLAAPLTAAPRAKKATAAQSAFFLGNSYTFVNDLPAVVAAMCKAGKTPLEAYSYTAGGMALIQFWEDVQHAKAREQVKKGGYNFVVLQDQSVTPCTTPEWTFNFGGKWAQLARQQGATPVFFITWAHLTTDGVSFDFTMQDELTATYRRTAAANQALCAPVGEAWRRWYKKHPDQRLHTDDGSHPNALGTYLAGCVFYRTLTGKSAVGLPCRLRDGRRVLLSVPADKAKECQQIADAAVKAEEKAASAPTAE